MKINCIVKKIELICKVCMIYFKNDKNYEYMTIIYLVHTLILVKNTLLIKLRFANHKSKTVIPVFLY
jgi:hypothetical protein